LRIIHVTVYVIRSYRVGVLGLLLLWHCCPAASTQRRHLTLLLPLPSKLCLELLPPALLLR
jgi:hypothetical protein